MPGLLSRLFGREAGAETRSLNSAQPLGQALEEIFRLEDGWGVSPARAEQLSAVTASVDAIAGSLASVPIFVQRHGPDGPTDLPDHPAARVLRRPNDVLIGPDFVCWLLAQALLHGNGLCIVERDGAGRPAQLVPVPWPQVAVVALPSGKLGYDITFPDGRRRRFLADEVLHLRDRSDDGRVGRARLSRAGPAIANALSLQSWCSAAWENAGTPSAALQIEQSLQDLQYQRIRTQVDQNIAGTRHARKILILDNGAKWVPMSLSLEDAQVLESRRLAVEEAARLFNVPSPIINDLTHGTFTNSETMLRHFASSTLTWWARRLEACLERALLGSGSTDVRILVDLSGLLRGSHTERWQAHKIALETGALTEDEVRELEGYGPKPAQQQGAAE